MKFAETPYFILKEYLTDNYASTNYIPFPNTDYNKSIKWDNILFSSRQFDSYQTTGGAILINGDVESADYYTNGMIASAGTSGGVYFFDRRDEHYRERIKFNMSSYATDSNIWAMSSSGDCALFSVENGIITDGGDVDELFIKHNPDDELGSDKQKGYFPLNFTYVDFQDENLIRISVHNDYKEYPGSIASVIPGSSISGGYFLEYDTTQFINLIIGREVYFRKDSMFHDWLTRFAQDIIREKFGIEIDIRGYINTDKMFIYLGKIYEAAANEEGINYIIEYYGLKDYIFTLVPQHQRTPNLKEFINIAFDRLYHNIYTRQKDGYTPYDPSEVDIKYIGYLSQYYGMTDFQPIVQEDSVYREFVKNIIHLLKRKGTFSDLYAVWSAVTQTTNRLNVYERWIPSGNQSLIDTTRVVQEDEWEDIIYTSLDDYNVSVYTDGAGVGWYAEYPYIDITNLDVCTPISSSVDFPDYPLNRYSMDDMVLSSNYRVELDINSEPLSNTSVFSKATFDGLYDAFETVRPVYRTCRYSVVFSPIVDLTGDVMSLYGDKNSLGESYTNTYVNSRSFTQDYYTATTYIGLQCVSASEWVFHTDLNTQNLIIQCFDKVNNLITPISTVITNNGENVLVTFSGLKSGYIVIKKANKTPITTNVGGNQILSIEHSLNRDDLFVQVYEYNTINGEQSLIDIDSVTIIDDNNIEIDIGIGNISINTINVHLSSNETLTLQTFETSGVDNSCIVNHDFESKLIFIQSYDTDGVSIVPDDIKLLNIMSTKLTFSTPQSGTAILIDGGSYNILQELIGFDSFGIQNSPTYKLLDGDQNVLETGVISEFKRDNRHYYMNWGLDYASEYEDIATIEIISRDKVQFRTTISDLYKPPYVDFLMHYRVIKTAMGETIAWNDVVDGDGATSTTIPINQCGSESLISISTNAHPSVLTWDITSTLPGVVWSDTGTKTHTGYHPLTDSYYIDPLNPDLYVVTLGISCSGSDGEDVTISVSSGTGVYIENTLTTVYEGISYIDINTSISNFTINPYETAIVYVKTDAASGDLTWTLSDPAYVFVGDMGYYSQGFSHIVSATGAARNDVTVTVEGCIYSDTWLITNEYIEAVPEVSILTLDNPNAYGTSDWDKFGYSIAISDTYAIIGAPEEDGVGGGIDSGKAYIFDNATGVLLHTLDNPNAYDTSAGDSFGYSVAISDTYTAVATPYEGGIIGNGVVYIYTTSTGSLLHTLTNPSLSGGFASSISINDTYTIIGAYEVNDIGGVNSGKAYIYNTITGTLLHTLDNPNAYDTSAGDQFGNNVSISDTYSIVGAYAEDDAGGLDSGKAYIYDNATGALLWTLDNPNAYDTSAVDYFGISVSISDTYSIVGAYQEGDAGGLGSGKAYIYDNATGALLWTLDNPNAYGTSADDQFGYSVSISDSYAIVGAYREDSIDGTNSGKAYIFDNATGALLHTLDNPNAYDTTAGDRFGYSVGISNTHAIVGAYSESDDGGTYSGKTYIYKIDTL
jgi:hypothetical protein